MTCETKDSRQPYSFAEFLQTVPAVEPRDDRRQYQAYLIKWFDDYYTNTADSIGVEKLSDDYEQVLKRLFIIFKNDPVFKEFGEINFNNTNEIRMLLPVFAEKLRKIAMYIVAKRESIKRTKLRASTVGSNQGVVLALYEYLLKTYTQDSALDRPVSNVTVIEALENLDDIKEVFSVEIQELYEKGDGGK
jgi:hypothetical protein